MRQLLHALLKWVGQRLVWFVLIVAILMAGAYLKEQFDEFHASQSHLGDLKVGQQVIENHVRSMEQALTARAREFEKASLGTLDGRIAGIDQAIGEKSAAQQGASNLPLLLKLATGSSFIDPFKRDIEIKVLMQERDYLVGLRAVTLALVDRDRGVTELERLRRVHAAIYGGLKDNEFSRDQVRSSHPVAGFVPGTVPHGLLVQLALAHASLTAQNLAAYEAYERQRMAVALFKMPHPPPAFRLQYEQIRETLAPLDARIKALEKNTVAVLWESAAGVVQAALWILVSLILLPVAIKVFFYFVLAPLAARRPPVHLLPGASGMLESPAGVNIGSGNASASAVSQTLRVGPGHELLIDPAYLQSAPIAGAKVTKWLLDWSHPLTSLAAGLVALTRIRVAVPESIVISATVDPLSEVGVLALPAGSALVLQPRSLVGVLQPRDQPLRITSHWRLGTLHGWLTLQLRYLVLHGPATLIIKGCRGVRVERAGDARRINQAATLGFSANLQYSTTRAATFFPYLTGKQGLLDDSFAGAQGYYVYEEMPHAGAKAGVGGRGLEGISDAVLKMFGI